MQAQDILCDILQDIRQNDMVNGPIDFRELIEADPRSGTVPDFLIDEVVNDTYPDEVA